MLPFGPECMLQRVVRLMSQVIAPANIVVVAASRQSLPPLPPEVRVTRDEHEDRGPLEGLAAGLRCLGNDVDAAYVTSCDVPLLVPAFVTEMFAKLTQHDIAVPSDHEHVHPLSAVYRCTVLPQIERLLSNNKLRLRLLMDAVSSHLVSTDELRNFDPNLATLENLNSPADYRRCLFAAGFADTGEILAQG